MHDPTQETAAFAGEFEPVAALTRRWPASLERLLERTARRGFKLVLVEVATQADRRWLLSQTRVLLASQSVQLLEIDVAAFQGMNFREDLIARTAEKACGWEDVALAFVGFEEPAVPSAAILRQLNVQRDSLVRDFPCPWILFVHPALRPLLHRVATDFCDFAALWVEAEPSGEPAVGREVGASDPHDNGRSVSADPIFPPLLREAEVAMDRWENDRAADLIAQFELAAPQDGYGFLVEVFKARLLHHQGANREAHEWLSRLVARMEGSVNRDSQSDQALAYALLELGRLDVVAGELGKAEYEFRRSHALYLSSGNAVRQAEALGEIARIRADKGEVDAALALHKEMLGIFESLGDKRSRAVTLGDIARIRRDKGEVDAALALHKEELEVYESLGDKRSRAVTLGDIARIRSAK
jgi:acetolactate synthase regulatory subunit